MIKIRLLHNGSNGKYIVIATLPYPCFVHLFLLQKYFLLFTSPVFFVLFCGNLFLPLFCVSVALYCPIVLAFVLC